MKAILEVSKRGSAVPNARAQLAASRRGVPPDFKLSFESARALFTELTPARVDLLDTLRRVGPCSVYAFAKAARRNYSNVHTDVRRLEETGLIERADDGAISVPFESVEILIPLVQVARVPPNFQHQGRSAPAEKETTKGAVGPIPFRWRPRAEKRYPPPAGSVACDEPAD